MRLLLDTCTFLWMLSAEERLGAKARQRILDPRTELYLSAASSWEIAIKVALGRLELPGPADEVVPTQLERNAIRPLPIAHAHALRTATLPPHHRDPFDRMLVAQALCEELAIVTSDPAFAAYDVARVW